MSLFRSQGLAHGGALAAIAIWASLAALSVSLTDLPVLQLTGMALVIGGLLSVPWAREWSLSWQPIALGCYGLLLYHLLFILALRWAPPVQANLVHYVWPMLIVLLSPVILKSTSLRLPHIVAAVLGFAGAALAILSTGDASSRWEWGYALALAAALVWSTYSLGQRRVQESNVATTGLCCLISGAAALGIQHCLVAPLSPLTIEQWLSVAALGLGPMGGAFYLWNYALRNGDPRVVGVMANATPVLSTLVLAVTTSSALNPVLLLSLLLIVGSTALVFAKS